MKTQSVRSKIAEQNAPESCEYCKFIRYDSATGEYKCAFAKCAYYEAVEKRKARSRFSGVQGEGGTKDVSKWNE